MSKPGRRLLYIGRHPRGISGSRGVGGPDRLRVCFFPADPTAGRGLGLLARIASVERWVLNGRSRCVADAGLVSVRAVT
jgi:hypothetical protein